MYWYVLVCGVFYERMSWGKWDDVILVTYSRLLLGVVILFYICCDG